MIELHIYQNRKEEINVYIFLCKIFLAIVYKCMSTYQNGFADNSHRLAGWGGREVYREIGKT